MSSRGGHSLLSDSALLLAALLTLAPVFVAGFAPARLPRWRSSQPAWAQTLYPAVLALPYALVTVALGTFRWPWLALYALLPIAVSAVLLLARRLDPGQRGTALDLLILAVLGLSVDLRWFERAWPPHLSAFNKLLLLDLGIYGFTALRQLTGIGFDLRLRPRDLLVGLREYALYAPIAVALGLALGFLHLHHGWPSIAQLSGALAFTFLFIAIPEELFFRGWLQNLLERRLGRTPALLLTAALFGLSHFNKRAAHFNWRYVLLAAIAGVFYGRAWRQDRRVAASSITHTLVDTTWSLWLR